MGAIRVLVVDDHPVVRKGVRSLLAHCEDIQVVGEAGTRAELWAALRETRPDVLLLDIRLAEDNGVDIAQQVRRAFPDVKIIVLTTFDDETYLYGALRAGVHAYLLKSASHSTIADAVRGVFRGERLLSPSLVGPVLRQFEHLARAQAQMEAGLSGQDVEVLRLIAAGATTREIADALYWSEATLKRRIQDILGKLGAANRAQAVAEAIRRGLI